METRERPLIDQDDEKRAIAEGRAFVVDRFDYTDGIKVYLKGHKYPYKGMPTEAAVGAVNVIKRFMRLRPFQALWMAIEPHILKEEFRQPLTKELCKMFPGKVGLTVAHVIEYDSAYRLFIQDLFSETTKEALLANPIGEVRRLLAISARRTKENPVARKKMAYAGYIFMALLFVPKIRKAFRQCDFSKLQCDDGDRYWLALRTDYNARA